MRIALASGNNEDGSKLAVSGFVESYR